jgi:TolB-like protein
LTEDREMGLRRWLLGPRGSEKKPEGEAGETAKPQELDEKRIAVLPFANMSPDPTDGYFADGMTEELITWLSGVRELSVIARTSVMKYKASPKGASEIGNELKAGTLIEGSVRKAGNRVRITVQLIDARSEDHIWAQNYDKQLDDIFAIQSEIAEKVAGELRIKLLESERQGLQRRPTASTEAYSLYLMGRHHWNERSVEEVNKAIECFNNAIKIDSGFALGYAGLADCYYVMAHNYQADPRPTYQMAKQYATRALELDYGLAEAHAALATVMTVCEHQWEAAEAGFKRAIELRPSYSSAHHWYANLLLFQRRLDEAEVETRRAVELDPFSLIPNATLCLLFYYRMDFDGAIAQAKKVLSTGSNVQTRLPPNLIWIAPYVQKEMYEEALREMEVQAALPGRESFAKLCRGYVYAAMGKADESRRLLREAAENYRVEHLSSYAFARAYFLLGDNEQGFLWMQRGFGECEGLVFFPADFELERARDDPLYLPTLKKMGLEKILPEPKK